MKNQYLITLFLATLMALTASSCKKDPVSPDPEIPEAATVILNAEIQKPFNGYDKDTFCWLNGDEVYINNAVYPIMDASGTSARIENVDSAKIYTAVFPASIVPAGTQIIPREYFLVTLPSTQVYHTVDGIQRVDMPMGAYLTKGNKLLFHVLCSIIRITINNHLSNGLSLESIALSAEEGYLSGTGTAYIPGYEDDDIFDRIPVGKLGFYTDDPDEFEARIAEIEADLDEVEAGFEDPEKWITSEQMHKDFLKMFPWLR